MPLHLTMRGKKIPVILLIVFVFLSIIFFQANTASAVVIYNESTDEFLVIPSAITQTVPQISITTPLDNEQIYSNTVYISGTMENAATVKVNGVAATVSGNTFWAKLTLTAGSNTLTAIATDPYSRTAVQSITVVNAYNGQIVITITSPEDGATINGDSVMFAGTVTNAVSHETGVTVNGVAAALVNGQFAVSNVPLSEGFNIITVTATDTAGTTATQYIAVIASIPGNFIKLSASPASGIAPLTVSFIISATLSNSIANYQIDFDGNGTIDYNGATFDNINYTYTTEGIYHPTLTVTDSAGNSYSGTATVSIQSRSQLDTTLKAKWAAMKAALLAGNVDTALSYFIDGSQSRYRAIFTGMNSATINEIFSGISSIEVTKVNGRIASCGALRNEAGGTYSYPLIYIQDNKGIWKILGF
jgi:PKD repeat protein